MGCSFACNNVYMVNISALIRTIIKHELIVESAPELPIVFPDASGLSQIEPITHAKFFPQETLHLVRFPHACISGRLDVDLTIKMNSGRWAMRSGQSYGPSSTRVITSLPPRGHRLEKIRRVQRPFAFKQQSYFGRCVRLFLEAADQSMHGPKLYLRFEMCQCW